MRFLRSARILRRLMLAAGILALTPATGTALCLGELGHVTLELVDQACFPTGPGADACATECEGCEDIPLAYEVADRVSSRDVFSDGLRAPVSSVVGIFPGVPVQTAVLEFRPTTLASLPLVARPAQLRC